jgi:TM2 domain-containing membrane protein YozV
MEQSKVEMFIASMNEKFPSEKLMLIRDQLSKLEDSKMPVIQSIQYKNPTTLLIISLFLGSLGVDRFMMGETGLGVVKLITCGGCGVWTIIDWFTIMGKAREWNYQKFCQVAI